MGPILRCLFFQLWFAARSFWVIVCFLFCLFVTLLKVWLHFTTTMGWSDNFNTVVSVGYFAMSLIALLSSQCASI